MGSDNNIEKKNLEKRLSNSEDYNDDDECIDVELPAELPPPPDGGWGWVVVFASFICSLVVDGTAYSFSPFLIVFSDYFVEPQGKVAWISSLMCGFCLMAGPIASALVNKFGCRIVCIAGAFIASGALAATAFANSVIYLMIFQGVITGLGFGLIYLPAIVCVGYYFESKRAVATGIAVCGSGVGTIVLPPLATILIDKLGWQGANLCFAGFVLSLALMGALMRPLEVPKMKRKDLFERLAEEKKLAMDIGSIYGSNYCFVTHTDGSVEKRIRPGSNLEPGVHSHLNLTGYNLSPVGTSLNLPTIEEGVQLLDEDVIVKKISAAMPTIDEDSQSNMTRSPSRRKYSVRSKDMNRFIRNMSHNSMGMGSDGGGLSKVASVLSFERKMSKVDLVNMMKVVPGISEPTFTNLGSSTQLKSMDSDSGELRLRRQPSKESINSIMLPPMARQDIFYTGKIKQLEEFKSQASMVGYRESTFNLQEVASRVVLEALDAEDEADIAIEGTGKCIAIKECCAPAAAMVDFSLMKNPLFLLVGFANLIAMLGFYAPFIYLPAVAIEKGVDKELATLLISIIGISSTIGRILSGVVGSIPQVNVLWVNNISLFISGLTIILMPLAESFAAFVSLSLFFGFASAAFMSLTSIILVDLLGLRNLTNAFGLLLLFRGLASMVGSPLAGTIYDATQSYDASFYFSGSLWMVCGIMYCLIPLAQRCAPDPQEVVMYHTNEDYLQSIPEEDMSEEDEDDDDDKSQSADREPGLFFNIKTKVFPKLSLASLGKSNEERAGSPTSAKSDQEAAL